MHIGVVMQLRGIGSASRVEILKFVRPETAFDPEFIQVLASALGLGSNNLEVNSLGPRTRGPCAK